MLDGQIQCTCTLFKLTLCTNCAGADSASSKYGSQICVLPFNNHYIPHRVLGKKDAENLHYSMRRLNLQQTYNENKMLIT